jgi:Arc/MetJ family transcription regulator
MEEATMRTTINIKEETVQEVMHITGAKNKSQAINEALEAYVQEKRMKKLLELKGKLNLNENWKALREMELDET